MILLTGASGFIGRHLAISLRQKHGKNGLFCFASDSPSCYEREGRQILLENDIDYGEVDLLRPVSFFPILRQKSPLVILHLAAETSTCNSSFLCNDVGTRNLIDGLTQLGPSRHFVFTSSVAVLDGRRDTSIPIEDDRSRGKSPFSEYGRSKLWAENILKEACRLIGFRLTILRLVTVYGRIPKPESFLSVVKYHTLSNSLASRLDWPGMTGLLHLEDLINIIPNLIYDPPPPGEPETLILQSESIKLATIFELAYKSARKKYRPIVLPKPVWRLLGFGLKSLLAGGLEMPGVLFQPLWRANIMINNVFWSRSVLGDRGVTTAHHYFHNTIGDVF